MIRLIRIQHSVNQKRLKHRKTSLSCGNKASKGCIYLPMCLDSEVKWYRPLRLSYALCRCFYHIDVMLRGSKRHLLKPGRKELKVSFQATQCTPRSQGLRLVPCYSCTHLLLRPECVDCPRSKATCPALDQEIESASFASRSQRTEQLYKKEHYCCWGVTVEGVQKK